VVQFSNDHRRSYLVATALTRPIFYLTNAGRRFMLAMEET
jgi:hypothetical protein